MFVNTKILNETIENSTSGSTLQLTENIRSEYALMNFEEKRRYIYFTLVFGEIKYLSVKIAICSFTT